MKVSREQVQQHRERILAAASRLFRERGVAGVSVAEITNAAGLTHGGFYGHFESKDALVQEALAYKKPSSWRTRLAAASAAEYAADVDREETKWSTLIKKLNLKVE